MNRIIISGGGTGGHVFPAIAIANALKSRIPRADILFIGAKGKLEMEKVPAAGYRIEGLTIAGFQRRLTLKNLSFPFKLALSMIRARSLVSAFRPDLVIGVGGYASGPVLRTAVSMNIPALIQEQNSYPGITNRMLAGKVEKICVAYEGMDRFFPSDKLVLTGNPIRQDLSGLAGKRDEAISHFNLKKEKTTVLVIGGSLGAGTINRSVMKLLASDVSPEGLQWLWQCGKYYYESLRDDLSNAGIDSGSRDFRLNAFIDRMDLAYAAADIVISRAGAIAISELCAAGKPCILIPSPNVAEDHQTKNAQALVNRQAAIMLSDMQAPEELGKTLRDLVGNKALQADLSRNILSLAVPDAAGKIAEEAIRLMNRNT